MTTPTIGIYSIKGGVGATTATGLLAIAATADRDMIAADLCGDLDPMLGRIPTPTGLAEWSHSAATDSLNGLQRDNSTIAGRTLKTISRGFGPFSDTPNLEQLPTLLAAAGRPTLFDIGNVWSWSVAELEPDMRARREVLDACTHTYMVVRRDFMGLRRASKWDRIPTGVIVMNTPGTVITIEDVEQIVGAPVVLTIDVTSRMGRVIDGGLLGHAPRLLAKDMQVLDSSLRDLIDRTVGER